MTSPRGFTRLMFRTQRRELVARVGAKDAKVFLDRHMDVCRGSSGYYLCHWVKWPEGGLDRDLYGGDACGYIKAEDIWDARAQAIQLLLDALRPPLCQRDRGIPCPPDGCPCPGGTCIGDSRDLTDLTAWGP